MKTNFTYLIAIIVAILCMPSIGNAQLLTESFEGSFPPSGWTIVNNGTGNDWVQDTMPNNASDGVKSMKYIYDASSSGDTYAFTKGVYLTNGLTYSIKFDYKAQSSFYAEKMRVTIGTANTVASTTDTLWDNNGGTGIANTSYAQGSIFYTATATDSVYFGFNCYSDPFMYYLFVDNIVITQVPQNDIEVMEVLGSYGSLGQDNYSVKVVLKNSGTQNQTNVPMNYKLAGGTVVSETMSGTLAALSTDTFTFTTLLQGPAAAGVSSLVVYSSLSTDSDNSNDTTFIDVENMAIPHIEGFEAYAYGGYPKYWTKNIYGNGLSSMTISYAAYAHSGSNYMGMFSAVSGTPQGVIYNSLPAVASNLTNLRIEFYVINAPGGKFIIGVMDDVTDTTTFVALDTVPASLSYLKYGYSFSQYTGSGKYVTLKRVCNATLQSSTVDDLKLFVPVADDIAVKSFTRTYGGAFATSNDTVTVVVENNGDANQTSVPIKFVFDNGSVVSELIPNIAAFTIDTFEFVTTIDASVEGLHTLTVYSELPNDVDNSNDTISVTFKSYATHTLPLNEGFENNFKYFDNATTNKTGFTLIDTLTHSGNHAAYNQYATSSNDILHEIGVLDLTATTAPVITFWHIALLEGPSWDKGFVEVSTNNGLTWTALDSSDYLGESTVFQSSEFFGEASYTDWQNGTVAANDSMWKMEKFSLSNYKDDSVRIRFRLFADSYMNHEGWFIDDIVIQEDAPFTVDLGSVAAICNNNAAELNSGIMGYEYLWTFNGDTLVDDTYAISVSVPGVYTVEVSGLGSVAYDTITVTTGSISFDLGADIDACINHIVTIDAGVGYTSYLWSTGDTTQILTVDSNSFKVGNNDYTAIVTNAVGCETSDTITLIVDLCTGILTPEMANTEMKIFPNPSNGLFQIQITGIENQDYNLDVYNTVGAVVYSNKLIYSGKDTQTMKLDFSNFAKGVYYIRLFSDGEIKVKSLIIK